MPSDAAITGSRSRTSSKTGVATWTSPTSAVYVKSPDLTGGALFAFRRGLADFLTDDAPETPGLDLAALQAAAIAVVGLDLFVKGLSAGLSTVVFMMRTGFPLHRGGFSDNVEPWVQSIMGAGMFVGAPGIVRLWKLLRTVGTRAEK